MEELNTDFKRLIIIEPHHHDEVMKASFADTDQLLISIDGFFQPFELFLEKLAVEHGDIPGQNFENVPSLPHIILESHDFVSVSGQREDFVELDGSIFEHIDKLVDFFNIVIIDFETGNFDEA